MPNAGFSVVDGFVPVAYDPADNLRENVWDYALDQRAFGPRKIVVVFAASDGRFLGLAYTDRTDPPELGFNCCLHYLGAGADAAIAFCDQPVVDGPPPVEFVELFERAQALAAGHGIHLVDWIACDDDKFRSNRTPAAAPGQLPDDWWDVPRADG